MMSIYFTDVPMTAVIPSIILKHAGHHAPISKFFHDCQAGTLPSVSFVDPGVGVVSSTISALSSLPFPIKEIPRDSHPGLRRPSGARSPESTIHRGSAKASGSVSSPHESGALKSMGLFGAA